MKPFVARDRLDGAALERAGAEERERLFALSLDLLCVAGVDGYFKELSPSWNRILGFTLDELRSQPFLSYVHPDDHAATLDAVADLGRGREIASFTNRYRRKEGTYAQFEWSAAAIPDRGLIYAVARDVSERERAEAAQRAAHDRLQHLLHASRVVLYAATATDYAVTLMSDNVLEHLGYHPKQFTEDAGFWVDRIHPDDRARVLAELSHVHELNRYSLEYRWLRKDGQYRWLHDDCKLVRDAEGQPLELLGAWQDVTERREAEQTIKYQAAALLELSTPLIPISDEILVMPLIGVVDSRRAAQMLETLLNGIVARSAEVAILDITGVSVVDTKVADTLLRAARAVQLLGARVILTGIRPDVAQTLVGLGAELGGIITCGTLQAGIRHAMRQRPAAGARR
jgi:rsbT co-antagonist protein RsbR